MALHAGQDSAPPDVLPVSPEADSDVITTLGSWVTNVNAIVAGLAAIAGAIVTLTNSGRSLVKGIVGAVRSSLGQKKRSKGALADLAGKINDAPKLEERDWSKEFTQSIEISEAAAAQVKNCAKLVVVASGKGGVGKSTLALGLMEAYCAAGERTLLIDFDMHNRGLTSMLGAWEDSPDQLSSCFSEAERFHNEIAAKLPVRVLPGQPESVSSSDAGVVLQLMRSFASDDRGLYKDLPVIPLLKEPFLIDSTSVAVHHPWFLPSLLPKERFLGSKIFDVGFVEVFYFLKFIQFWASHSSKRIDRIVVDCHGAHDLLMIGAIHAASGLVIATTPDVGSFDGTYDLIAFANLLRGAKHTAYSAVVVINNCEEWQRPSAKAIEEFLGSQASALKIEDVVTIGSSDRIREVANKYSFGDVSRNRVLWKAVCEIRDGLSGGEGVAVVPTQPRGKPLSRPVPENRPSQAKTSQDRAGEKLTKP